MASSWFVFFGYHNAARSNKHEIYVLMFVFQRRTHIGLLGYTTDLPDNTVSSERTSYNYFLEIHYGVFHMSRRCNCGCLVLALPVRGVC